MAHFFDDPNAWNQLVKKGLEPIARRQQDGEKLRAWVPGCATGEEAYTLAILLIEALQDRQKEPRPQIFASDADGAALAFARDGLYHERITADLSPARLRRFFDPENHGYRVKIEVRDSLIFAKQNLTTDPPFGRLDLISCRRALLGLEPAVREKIIHLFHFALQPHGLLFLDDAEPFALPAGMFKLVSEETRLYRRIGSNESDQINFMDLLLARLSCRKERIAGTALPYPQNAAVKGIDADLQTTRKVLESSKENLQSLNEELITINRHLESKNRELEAANDDLKNLLTSAQIATLFLDRHCRIRRFTAMMTELARLRASDIGRPLTEISTQFDTDDLQDAAEQVLEDLEPREKEFRVEDGRWFLRRVLPYSTEYNRIDGVVVTFVETTARRFADERLRFVIEFSDTLRALKQPSEIIAAAARLTGQHFGADRCTYGVVDDGRLEMSVVYDYGEEAPSRFGHYDLASWQPEVLNELRHNRPLVIEDTETENPLLKAVRSVAFTRGMRALLLVPLTDENAVVALLCLGQKRPRAWADHEVAFVKHLAKRSWLVVEKAQAEQALRADEIRLLQQAEALRAADRQKNVFLGVLGHELRNPLAAISTNLELLQQLLSPDTRDGDTRQALFTLSQQTERITRVVNDLLDIVRITTGRFELKRQAMNLEDCIQSVAAEMGPQFAAKQQRFRVETPEDPLWLNADSLRLEQILSNLLSNAIKYTDAGGTITLIAERENDRAIIRVRDTGIGIAPHFLPNVFDAFTRDDDRSFSVHTGLGLGLTLVKNLVELHGGRIEAASEGLGQGTEFTVRLPALARAPEFPQAPAQRTGPEAPVRPLRILVIDDDPAVAGSFAALLERSGHAVQSFNDGPTALEAAGRFLPEVAFLDLALPEMNGFEIARRLRAAHDGLLLIAVTGFMLNGEYGRRARDAGFDHYLLKPINLGEIKTLLGSVGR